ncbi:hypothetical protein N9N67_04655 [Bacteriovoracaceae bacterium]|nr:hypothetical protein [Bacteriovoracaceae bacterium]
MKKIILFFFLISHAFSFEYCRPQFTPDEKVSLKKNSLLIVTHATTEFDELSRAKKSTNLTIQRFLQQNNDVVYLQGEAFPEKYYYQFCTPKYYVLSYGGEFFFNFSATDITTIGGHWQACQLITTRKIISNFQMIPHKKNFSLTQVMSAIYTYGKISVYRDDPYYQKVMNKISKIGTNKLTLQDILHEISTVALKEEFLSRMVDHFEIPNEFHVEIKLKNQNKIIYQAPESFTKSLLIKFI